jgi:hypothetical protein
VILSSSRLKLRKDDDGRSGRLKRAAAWASWLPASPVVSHAASLTKWGAGAVMTVAICMGLLWGVSKSAGPVSGGGAWASIQRTILNRAAISLTDDFRSGLAQWEGEANWARSWSYDNAGFVRTGAMAVYTPSVNLTDYRVEFLGQIEKKALSWAVRAADVDNYYAVRIVLDQDGPTPWAVIERYPVIDGKRGQVTQTDLSIPVTPDMLYRALMEVRGNDYVLSLNGKVVDTWTDDSLRAGGVAFFSRKGELARLRWVGVWHQYDTLGRLCAYLAPNTMPNTERSMGR